MEELREMLIVFGAKFKGNSCTCPFHDDKHASAGIYQTDNGNWRFKCQACGINKTAWELKHMIEQPKEKFEVPKVKPQPLDTILQGLRYDIKYQYTDPDTKQPDLIILRTNANGEERKKFIQISKRENGYVRQGLTTNPIYNRTRVRDAPIVFVVEGEKCVHALQEVDVVATTSPGGSGQPAKADWSPLNGKQVFIIPDNDEVGQKYAETVYSLISGNCKAHILQPVGDTPGSDIADIPIESRLDVVMSLKPINPDIELLEKDMEDTFSGRKKCIPLEWEYLFKSTQSFRPGTVTVLCGPAGAAKSYWLSQCQSYWTGRNVSWATLALEEDKPYWVYRALAQRVNDSKLSNLNWRTENREAVERYYNENRDWVRDYMGKLTICNGYESDVRYVKNWLETTAKNGTRIVVVDPITLVNNQDRDGWKTEGDMFLYSKKIAEDYGCSVLLVTHPTKNPPVGKDGHIIPSFGALAGSSTINRAAACVLWLKNVDDLVTITRPSCMMNIREDEHVDKALVVLKARDGEILCNLRSIGYRFKDLKFHEEGFIK